VSRGLAWTHAGVAVSGRFISMRRRTPSRACAIRLINEVRSGAESLTLDRHAD
jgi:hypothetical protein